MQTPDPIVERLRAVHVSPRTELEVSRHVFRGEPSYVIRDPISFRSHRLSEHDYQVFVAISVRDSLETIFSRLRDQKAVDASQEAAFYRFVLELGQLGLLNLPLSDGKNLYARFARRKQTERQGRLWSLLFLRVPLVCPDRFLDATVHLVAPLFTRYALYLWSIGVITCGCLIASRAEEFRHPLNTLLASNNLPWLWALLVGLKVIHEFGHAYACKRFGGNVPEMGAYLVLFTPCAYVDASSSWGFTRRLERVIVGLGGMYFESIAAIFATLVWAVAEPGPFRQLAQSVLLLASVVTVGFNANPLMKYDGYYILSDVLGLPNLRGEAHQQLLMVLHRWLFRRTDETAPDTPIIGWLVAFGAVAALYKWLLFGGILVAIAWKIPVIGIGVACAYALRTFQQLAMWVIYYLRRESTSAAHRRVAVSLISVGVALVALLLCLPVPWSFRGTGVVAREQEQLVRPEVNGFLVQSFAQDGKSVNAGEPLFQLEAPELLARHAAQRAQVAELEYQFREQLGKSPEAAASAQIQLQHAQVELDALAKEVERLVVRAPMDGELSDLRKYVDPGQYVRPGQPLARVVSGRWTVRATVTSELLADAQPRVGQSANLVLLNAPTARHQARIVRIAATPEQATSSSSTTTLATAQVTPSTNPHARSTFDITLECESPDATFFRHGMSAIVQFQSKRPALGTFLARRATNVLRELAATTN